MSSSTNWRPRRILIASANPLFSKGLRKLLTERWTAPAPEMRLVGNMVETRSALKDWQPDLVVVDYDDQAINRVEFLNDFVSSDTPMQVMLVSLQASGEVVVYDRHTLTPAQAEDWFGRKDEEIEAPVVLEKKQSSARKPRFFTWRWIVLTLLVLTAIGVFIRLGFWQLDRLAQRRAYNARVEAEISQSPLNLNQPLSLNLLPAMEFRMAVVKGVYDFSHEVLLRNQVWGNQLGAHVLTPLKIQGVPYAVLVDRGWIPFEQSSPNARQQFDEPGQVSVNGMIRDSQTSRTAAVGAAQNGSGGQQDAFIEVNLDNIQKQMDLKLLPVFIQQAPDPTWTRMPYRQLPNIDLTEGPHLGYAIQWFAFAVILAVGYPYFIRKQLRGQDKSGEKNGVRDEI
jgi:surfeit locus 1 family protein